MTPREWSVLSTKTGTRMLAENEQQARKTASMMTGTLQSRTAWADVDDSYTPGRYVVSWVGAEGARDPIALTSQVKAMRDGFERLGHKPALLLIVVADGEQDAAVALLEEALGD